MKRCKRLASEQHTTFRSLVEEGLEHLLAEREQRKPFKLRTIKFGSGGFQPGFEDGNWEKIRDEIYRGRGT